MKEEANARLWERLGAEHKRENASEDRMWQLSAEASDWEIAEAIAEWSIAAWPYSRAKARGRMHLSILHDVGARSTMPPCPMEYDWRDKNSVGITTTDEARARDWTIRALMLGYVVCRLWRRDGGGGGNSIGLWRRALKEREQYGAS